MANEQVNLGIPKARCAALAAQPCWQMYATVAEADECLTEHGHQLTD